MNVIVIVIVNATVIVIVLVLVNATVIVIVIVIAPPHMPRRRDPHPPSPAHPHPIGRVPPVVHTAPARPEGEVHLPHNSPHVKRRSRRGCGSSEAGFGHDAHGR